MSYPLAKLKPSLHWLFFLTLSLALGSCIPYDSTEHNYPTTGSLAPPPGGSDKQARYSLSDPDSQVWIKVYRGGRLASLGHNHLIAIRQLQGWIDLREPVEKSQVRLAFPVSMMALDLPANRTAAGEDFSKPISSKDITATRNNMLGEKMLQAQRYPLIELEVDGFSGDLNQALLHASIKVGEHTSKVDIPVQISIDAGHIEAQGHFSLKQTELGLTPFSLFAGTLKVKDSIDIEFDLKGAQPKVGSAKVGSE